MVSKIYVEIIYINNLELYNQWYDIKLCQLIYREITQQMNNCAPLCIDIGDEYRILWPVIIF